MERRIATSATAAIGLTLPLEITEQESLPSEIQTAEISQDPTRINTLELSQNAEQALAIISILIAAKCLSVIAEDLSKTRNALKKIILLGTLTLAPQIAEAREPRPSQNDKLPETVAILGLLTLVGASIAKTLENKAKTTDETPIAERSYTVSETPTQRLNDVELRKLEEQFRSAATELDAMRKQQSIQP